jgi:glutamate synthase domain-containing protein 2
VPPSGRIRCATYHSAFSDVDGLIEFVERLADATGLPVGVKSAVGDLAFWAELAGRMVATGAGSDFVTIDGGEGGTGAAPLTFSDHVALPFKLGIARVYPLFAAVELAEDVVFIGAGRLGFPDAALHAMALGCDMINVGREAMLSIGCVQALRCHTGACPTGVATQSRWLMRGLDPDLKSARAANYVVALRAEMLSLARACGARHPALIDPDRIEIVSERYASAPVREVFGYRPDWPIVSSARRDEVDALIGAPTPAPPPGPAAGEHAGFPGAGDPSRRHMDARAVGESASEAG